MRTRASYASTHLPFCLPHGSIEIINLDGCDLFVLIQYLKMSQSSKTKNKKGWVKSFNPYSSFRLMHVRTKEGNNRNLCFLIIQGTTKYVPFNQQSGIFCKITSHEIS